MNDKVKKLTEVFGWMLFGSVYFLLIFLAFALLQSPGMSSWWYTQNVYVQIFVCILGFFAWCLYTIIMFLVFWVFNALWLWFTKKIVKAQADIQSIKKKIYEP